MSVPVTDPRRQRFADLARQVRAGMTDAGSRRNVDEVDQLFAGFSQVVRRFADLDFIDLGGTLDLRRHIPGVTCVRIELPKREFLHLTTALVESGQLMDLSRQVTVTTSSTCPGYEETDAQALLFDPANTAIAVHTNKQHRPWMELTFEHPVDVQRLFLRNRTDAHAVRARGIHVLVRDDTGSWATVYDGVERERAFVEAVEDHVWHRATARRIGGRIGQVFKTGPSGRGDAGPTIDGHGIGTDASSGDALDTASGVDAVAVTGLARILTAVHLRDYGTARADLDRMEIPDADKARFTELLNRRIAHRGLEWNIHGIRRTFRFYSEQEKANYVDLASDIIECLQDVSHNVCFGFGAVLGIVREGDLLGYDDNLDVIVGFEPGQAATLTEGKEQIRDCLTGHGYVVSGSYFALHHVARPDGGPKVSVFAGIFEDDVVSWYPGKRGDLTRQMIFPPIRRKLLGRDCPVPRRPEGYLRQIYGPDWPTPDPRFRHRWKPGPYRDIR